MLLARSGLSKAAGLVLQSALLTGCSDDVPSACFKAGEHDTMSDGKIQRICSCAMQRVGSDRLSEADRSILVDVIKARSPKKEAEIRYRALSATWNAALGSCKAAG